MINTPRDGGPREDMDEEERFAAMQAAKKETFLLRSIRAAYATQYPESTPWEHADLRVDSGYQTPEYFEAVQAFIQSDEFDNELEKSKANIYATLAQTEQEEGNYKNDTWVTQQARILTLNHFNLPRSINTGHMAGGVYDVQTGAMEYYDNYNQSAKRNFCLLYTSPSPRDVEESRMPSSA